jgi:IS5 family transposase
MIAIDSTGKITKQQELFSYEHGYLIIKDDLLYKLKQIYDFDRWYKILGFRKATVGRKPIDIVLKAKMLLLQFLYGLSDREVERQCNKDIMFRYFCDLTPFEKAPNFTKLCKLRKEIKKTKINELFEDIVAFAREKGMITDNWSSSDSTHLLANVSESRKSINNEKSELSKEQKDPKKWRKKNPKPPVDKDARWGCKKKKEYFYGYKMHASEDCESEILTRLAVSSGEVYDGNYFPNIYETKALNVTADCAYRMPSNDFIIKANGSRNWIFKKGVKKQNKWIGNMRRVIERKFGEGKNRHGLFHCRYRGVERVKVECLMIAIAMNLKRIVRLTC